MQTLLNRYNRNFLMLSLLLVSGVMAAPDAWSDNSLESRWLFSLKHAHLDNGDSLRLNDWDNDETLSLNIQDMKRLFSRNSGKSGKHYSRLQFSPLNYQADINEKKVQLRLFYQF